MRWYFPIRVALFTAIMVTAGRDSYWEGLLCVALAGVACVVTAVEHLNDFEKGRL